MPISDEQLKPLLVQAQVLNDQGFDELVQQAHQSNESVIHALVKKELISDADLGKLIAAHYQAPFVQLSQLDIPEQILLTIPREVAHRFARCYWYFGCVACNRFDRYQPCPPIPTSQRHPTTK